MTVKRFVAPDMRRALEMVRQEMGADAIILSSQRTAKGVEVITSDTLETVARGGEERKAFGNLFDRDLDRPLSSDSAWQNQQGVATVAQSFKPSVGKLDAQRREQLEQEIEQARERMLAAKQQSPSSSIPTSRGDARLPDPYLNRSAGQSNTSAGPLNTSAEQRPKATPQSVPDDVFFQPKPSANRQMAELEAQVKQMAKTQPAAEQHQDDMRLSILQNEIADMRMLLEQQLLARHQTQSPFMDSTAATPIQQALQDYLSQFGLPASIVKQLVLSTRPEKRLNAAWRDALANLTRQIPAVSSDPVKKGGIFAFIGATGVGKTTTIAKLAARYVLEHGFGKVALVTTDTYRVGAHEQLRSLGRILNVPVRVVDQERNLPQVIAGLKNFPLILIDTAGFRQGDPLLKEQETILNSCPGLKRILVLACNSQLQTNKASLYAYGNGKVCGTILTKVDECASLGEVLGVILQQHLPVYYTTHGQAIPDDLAVASPAHLVAKAVSIMKSQNKNTFVANQN